MTDRNEQFLMDTSERPYCRSGATRYTKGEDVANLNPEQLRRLARLGAMARLEQLRAEESAIRAEFPELFGGRRSAAADGPGEKAPRKRRIRRRRGTSTMSEEARKAASDRMLKYWAERRKTQAEQ